MIRNILIGCALILVTVNLDARVDVSLYTYSILNISPEGNEITLDNGSRWEVDPQHRQVAEEWRMGDVIFLFRRTASHVGLRPYDYEMEHLASQTHAYTQMVGAPDEERQSQLTVRKVIKDLIILSDGSRWAAKVDRNIDAVKGFRVGDPVVISRREDDRRFPIQIAKYDENDGSVKAVED